MQQLKNYWNLSSEAEISLCPQNKTSQQEKREFYHSKWLSFFVVNRVLTGSSYKKGNAVITIGFIYEGRNVAPMSSLFDDAQLHEVVERIEDCNLFAILITD